MIDCLTPDAIYHTKIRDNSVTIKVDLPNYELLSLTEQSAEKLEMSLHRAIEAVLSGYFHVANQQDTINQQQEVYHQMDEALTAAQQELKIFVDITHTLIPMVPKP